jgi:hypothetical protein
MHYISYNTRPIDIRHTPFPTIFLDSWQDGPSTALPPPYQPTTKRMGQCVGQAWVARTSRQLYHQSHHLQHRTTYHSATMEPLLQCSVLTASPARQPPTLPPVYQPEAAGSCKCGRRGASADDNCAWNLLHLARRARPLRVRLH